MIDKIQIRLNNPAQYLACCGLLELAALDDPDSTGYFTRAEFVLESSMGLQVILHGLLSATVTAPGATLEQLQDDVPVLFNVNGHTMLLDWWCYDSAQTTKLKCWGRGPAANRNSSYYLFTYNDKRPGLLVASQRLLSGSYNPADIFDLRVSSKRLDVDPRTSWKVTDIGYSPNDAKDRVKVETYAVTELLAGIGLQRMRLRFKNTDKDDDVDKDTDTDKDEDDDKCGYFEYYAWSIPLCVQTIIAANYCDHKCRKFRFYRESRSRNNNRFDFAEEQF